MPETYTGLIFYGCFDFFGKVRFEILIKIPQKICQLTLSLTTKENSPKYRLQNRKHKFSGVKNLIHFKDAEVFTLKCYKFILT